MLSCPQNLYLSLNEEGRTPLTTILFRINQNYINIRNCSFILKKKNFTINIYLYKVYTTNNICKKIKQKLSLLLTNKITNNFNFVKALVMYYLMII